MIDVLTLIEQERTRQDSKWGADRHQSPYLWLPILLEEIGEVVDAADQMTEQISAEGFQAGMNEFTHELVQVAAVAIAWIEDLDRTHEGLKTQVDEIVSTVRVFYTDESALLEIVSMAGMVSKFILENSKFGVEGHDLVYIPNLREILVQIASVSIGTILKVQNYLKMKHS